MRDALEQQADRYARSLSSRGGDLDCPDSFIVETDTAYRARICELTNLFEEDGVFDLVRLRGLIIHLTGVYDHARGADLPLEPGRGCHVDQCDCPPAGAVKSQPPRVERFIDGRWTH